SYYPLVSSYLEVRTSPGGGALEAYARATDALLTAARTGRPHPCDAAFALRVTRTLAEADALLGAGG
ncbi:hypothetical protein ACWEWQ_28880, partial [Streptomyces sp. NPDC003832]